MHSGLSFRDEDPIPDIYIPIDGLKAGEDDAWGQEIETPVACGFIVFSLQPTPLKPGAFLERKDRYAAHQALV